MLKQILAKILPPKIFNFLKVKWNRIRTWRNLKAAYRYDFKLYSKYSASFGSNTATKLIGIIIKDYHVIEKGLTMPESRLGFGQQKLVILIQNCINYIQLHGEGDEQLNHAIQVIIEYKEFHNENGFKLEEETIRSIKSLEDIVSNASSCQQIETTKEDYFKYTESAFPKFAYSRASVRNFTEEDIPIEKIINALEISKKTPSACNRQAWRTYVYSDKKLIEAILTVQGGNRGFGHLTNKLIVITAELGVFENVPERYQAYIDGGMYAMNLLYGLHYEKIAACILNCSHSPEKDIKLRELINIKLSEVFIAMIVCGIPQESFKIAYSKRYNLEETNTIIK
nr:nitroreductase family protein [uncultured Draconibacterium sp.]